VFQLALYLLMSCCLVDIMHYYDPGCYVLCAATVPVACGVVDGFMSLRTLLDKAAAVRPVQMCKMSICGT
jgi:hypothetical protein